MSKHIESKILAGQNVSVVARGEQGTPLAVGIQRGRSVVRTQQIQRMVRGGIISGTVWGMILTSSVFGTLEGRRACRESFRSDATAIEQDLALAGRWAQPAQYYYGKAGNPGKCILYAPDHSTFPPLSSYYLAPGCTPAEVALEKTTL